MNKEKLDSVKATCPRYIRQMKACAYDEGKPCVCRLEAESRQTEK